MKRVVVLCVSLVVAVVAAGAVYFGSASLFFNNRNDAPPAIPARISGDSMSPALNGLHVRMTCTDCGYPFRFGVARLPFDDPPVCPNCGYNALDIASGKTHQGLAVSVDTSIYQTNPPQRWDNVAVRDPDTPADAVVKRVVGLPGEDLEIRDGDVFVNGIVLQKSLVLFHALAIPVFNDAYRSKTFDPPRWISEEGSAWNPTPDGYQLNVTGDEAAHTLTYRNIRAYRSSYPREVEAPVMDFYGENQELTRDLQIVRDMVIQFRLKAHGAGKAMIELRNGRDHWRVELAPSENLAALFRGSESNETAKGSVDLRQTVNLSFGVLDHSVFLADDSTIIFRHNFAPQRSEFADRKVRPNVPLSHSTEDETDFVKAPTRPFSISGRDIRLTISPPVIFRDVHYLGSRRQPERWRSNSGSNDEYVLLGDNPPVSKDSREWRNPVRREMILGKVRVEP